MLKFKFLTGDIDWKTYGGKFISKKLNNGEFNYWLVMEVINWWEETGDETQDQYCVTLSAVSPESVRQDTLNSAIKSCGWKDDKDYSAIELVEILHSYGTYVVLWQGQGYNIKQLMKEARKQADLSCMLFGFYMDRPQNRIGQTGWDTIRGQDLKEFFEINYSE